MLETEEATVLWFDVGFKRYTTHSRYDGKEYSCGLM